MGNGITRVDEQAKQARAEAACIDACIEKLDFYHLFWIYTLMSIAGLLIETAVSFPIDGIWKSRAGLVWGPFSPIYGLGAVLMTVCLHRLRHGNIFALFAVACLLGGTFEYMVGTFWQSMFGFVAWDYSTQPFNFGGKTCLGIALCWGFLGTAWIKVLLPGVIYVCDLIPENLRRGITMCAVAITVVDVAATLVAFQCWFDRACGIEPANPVAQLANQIFSDEFMANRFQTISMFPVLTGRV